MKPSITAINSSSRMRKGKGKGNAVKANYRKRKTNVWSTTKDYSQRERATTPPRKLK
jgi:hypothetical protein